MVRKSIRLSLQATVRPHARRLCGRRFECFCCVASATRSLTQSAFFLQREVQAFRKATEGQRRAPKRGVLFGEPGELLATMRTVISHKHGPLRNTRTFKFENIHTGHNECSQGTVLPWFRTHPRGDYYRGRCPVSTLRCGHIKGNAEVDCEEFRGFLDLVPASCLRREQQGVLFCHTLNTQ